MRMGRLEEAQKSLGINGRPQGDRSAGRSSDGRKDRWAELFKYPKHVMVGMVTGLTQTGGIVAGG